MKPRLHKLEDLIGKTITAAYSDWCTDGIVLAFEDSYCHFTVSSPEHCDDTYSVWFNKEAPVVDEAFNALIKHGIFTKEEVDKRLKKHHTASKNQQECHERDTLERLKKKYE